MLLSAVVVNIDITIVSTTRHYIVCSCTSIAIYFYMVQAFHMKYARNRAFLVLTPKQT